MPTFTGEFEASFGVAIEDRTQRHEFLYAARTLLDQYPGGLWITQARASHERVREVRCEPVALLSEGGSHASLGPTGGRIVEITFRDDAHTHLRVARRSQCCRQSGHTRTDHE